MPKRESKEKKEVPVRGEGGEGLGKPKLSLQYKNGLGG